MAIERVFTNSGIGTVGNVHVRYGDYSDYENEVYARMADAVDYEESYLAGVRTENLAYYKGMEPSIPVDDPDDPPNKSTIISTDVRDTVLSIMPSMMRIFTNFDEKIVEFVPHYEAQAEIAEQQYDYLNYVFHNENEGFMLLYSVIKDALSSMYGVTKWWTDFDVEVEEKTFTEVTPEQYQAVVYEFPDVEVEMGELTEEGLIDEVTFRYVKSKPICRVAAIPPEELRIDRKAKSFKTSPLVGHERYETLSYIIKRGYDIPEDDVNYGSSMSHTDERFLRNPGTVTSDREDGILFGEWWIRIDGDGDGIDELRYIVTVGDDRKILEDRIVSSVDMAMWVSDPQPHTVLSDCIAELVKDIQRIKTNMIRGQLDNLAESINPRMIVNELVTNIEDAMSDEIGSIIRTRGAVSDSVSYTRTPYAGDDVQVSIDYLDKVRASRTGITEASKGLDPKALQSTSLVGIDAIVSGAQERIELIARVIAETGLKPTLQGMLRKVTENPNRNHVVKLRGKFVEVDPSLFDPTMSMEVNPTLGRGTDAVRMSALQAILQNQTALYERLGPGNKVVSLEQMYNTQEDMLKMANIKNVSRYFTRPTPDIEEKLASAPMQPDAGTLLAQAELEKVKKDMVVAIDSAEREDKKLEFEREKFAEEADFKRDKLNIDASIRALQQMDKALAIDPAIKAANRRGN